MLELAEAQTSKRVKRRSDDDRHVDQSDPGLLEESDLRRTLAGTKAKTKRPKKSKASRMPEKTRKAA